MHLTLNQGPSAAHYSLPLTTTCDQPQLSKRSLRPYVCRFSQQYLHQTDQHAYLPTLPISPESPGTATKKAKYASKIESEVVKVWPEAYSKKDSVACVVLSSYTIFPLATYNYVAINKIKIMLSTPPDKKQNLL